MARRGASEGSIYRRGDDNRWVGVLHVGYAAGKRVRKSYYGATRAEVAGKVAAAIRNKQLGRDPVPEQGKVGDFLSTWLEDVCKRTVRASTHERYERLLRLHIGPEIGNIRLGRLRADDLDALYTRLLDKGLGAGTVRLAHAILHRGLAYAVRKGALAANPATIATAPSVPRREFRALSPEEAVRLLREASGDPLEGLYILALTTGMREAELLGLRWQDIDLDAARLSVVQQVYRLKGAWVYSPPKTTAARRMIKLSKMAVEALRRHRARQLEQRLQREVWADNDLIFCDPVGQPTAVGTLYRHSFWPLLERADLPRMTFHSLRHSAASLMLAENVHIKVVSEMLGHSNVGITLNVYSHILPGLQERAAEKMDRLLAVNS